MQLFLIFAMIVACSDARLRQGDTSEAGGATDPKEADSNTELTEIVSETLEGDPGGIFKSFIDAGRGKSDVRESADFGFVANEKPADQTIPYGSTTASKTINMTSSHQPRGPYRQNVPEREVITDTLTQKGREAQQTTPRDEIFSGREYKGLLDLLIVVDNSGSMDKYNQKLSENLNKLIPNISNTEWKIMLMTSEQKDPLSQECNRVITTSAQFTRKINKIMATGRNAWRENIFWQARKGLANCRGLAINRMGYSYWNKTDSANSWMRSGSTLAVLIITDEDFQCSRYSSCVRRKDCRQGEPVCEVADALSKLKCNSFHCEGGGLKREFFAYRGDPNIKKKSAFYGIIKKSDERCREKNRPGQTYDKRYRRIGGKPDNVSTGPTNPCYGEGRDDRRIYWHNIKKIEGLFRKLGNIDGSFINLLKEIGKDIEGKLRDRFQLRNNSDTIKSVTVAGQRLATRDYKRNGKYLVITNKDKLPQANERVVVSYQPYSTREARDYQRSFPLSYRPDPATVKVLVNSNRLRQSGNWQISGQSIEFLGNIKDKTPSGATIKVSYKRQNVTKQQVFHLRENNIDPQTVKVSKGCTGSYTKSGFGVTDRTVTFTAGNEPDHGQGVCFKYQTITNNYRYSFNIVPGGENVRCTVGRTTVDCRHNRRKIIFTDTDQFPFDVNGTQVSITYDKPQDSAFTAALDDNYLKDSVTLTSVGTICTHQQLVFDGNELNLGQATNNNCSFLADPEIGREMVLSYRTRNQTFTIDNNDLKLWRDRYKIEIWEVAVNDQPTTNYTIDKSNYTLSFTDDLDDNMRVAVTVSFMN